MECIKCKKSIPEYALFCQYCGKKQVAAPRKRKKRVNGMGTVIKKPGNCSKPWEVQKNGVHIGYYATRTDAERALSDLIDTKITDKFGMTFSEIYERWMPTHSKEIGPSGMSGYVTAYKHCSALYNKTFRSLRKVDFQAVIDSMEEKEHSRFSCEKVLQLFGQLSKWAIEEEDICRKNYARDVVITATEKKKSDFVFLTSRL